MDKELGQLEEWAVNLINDYEETLRSQGVTPSSSGGSIYKKLFRFSGELVANPEAYGELLEMARSQDMSARELLGAIRSIEDIVLGQKANVRDPVLRNMIESMPWNPADRRQIMSDVIHHLYAQRTGGDTLRRLSQPERAATRGALREEFGRWGNVPENLLSLFRSWHTRQERAIGSEAAAITAEGRNALRAGNQGTALIHDVAPNSPTISGTVEGTTASEVLPELRKQFLNQRTATEATLQQAGGVYRSLDDLVADKAGRRLDYTTTMSQADLEARRGILDAPENQADVVNIIRQGLRGELDIGAHGVRFIQRGQDLIEEVTRFPNRLMQTVEEAQSMQYMRQLNEAVQNPAGRRFGAALPFVGAGLGSVFVEKNREERLKEIEQSPGDPTLKANLVLDELAGWGDRATVAGATLSATGIGAVVGVPMMGVGETVSTVTGLTSLAFDGGRAVLKQLQGAAALRRKELERQEKLRSLPADAPERANALSVGFAGGM